MRNHGDSPRSPDHGYEAMAGDLAETIAAPRRPGRPARPLDGRQGGDGAGAHASRRGVRRLVVADMAPVAYGHSQIGYVRAMQAVDLAAVARRADADAALAAAVPEPGLRAFFLQSLALGRDGRRLEAQPRRARRARCRGSWTSPDLAGRFDGPTLFLTGATSDYVRPEHWPRHPRACSPPPATTRSPAPATGCTPTPPTPSSPPSTGFLDAP